MVNLTLIMMTKAAITYAHAACTCIACIIVMLYKYTFHVHYLLVTTLSSQCTSVDHVVAIHTCYDTDTANLIVACNYNAIDRIAYMF